MKCLAFISQIRISTTLFGRSTILTVDSIVEFYLIIYKRSILNYQLRLILLSMIITVQNNWKKSYYTYYTYY